MKNILTILIFCLLSTCLIGQVEIKEDHNSKRSNLVQVNTLIGSSKVGIGMRYKSLYSIKNIIKLGWGVGFDSYSSGVKRNFIPISIDAIGDVYKSGRTPFYKLSVGYGIPLKEEESFAAKSRGGLMIDFSIGYRSKKSATQPFVAVGYRMQNASYEGQDNDSSNDDKDVIYKRWSIATGIIF